MTFFFTFINILAQVLSFAVLARALLSWFPISPNNPLVSFIVQVSEPVLAPLRRIIPRMGMIDFTPVVAIIILQVVAWVASQQV